MTKYLIAALAVLGLALAGSLYALKLSRAEVTYTTVALESSQAALASQKALTAKIQARVVAEKTRADANRQELRNALKKNAEWAASAVPPDVAGVLCKPPALCSPGAGTVR